MKCFYTDEENDGDDRFECS